jgi:hypothetical protein
MGLKARFDVCELWIGGSADIASKWVVLLPWKLALEISKIEDLLGVAASSRDAQDLQATELRELVAALGIAAEEMHFDVTAIKPVPPEKLTYNDLPSHWQALIASGWQNTGLVAKYFNHHYDPLVGEKIAQIFRVRYQYLKAQQLNPGAIMTELYATVAGIGNVTAPRQVAAQALLAYLFECCDIFEDQPAKTKQWFCPKSIFAKTVRCFKLGQKSLLRWETAEPYPNCGNVYAQHDLVTLISHRCLSTGSSYLWPSSMLFPQLKLLAGSSALEPDDDSFYYELNSNIQISELPRRLKRLARGHASWVYRKANQE